MQEELCRTRASGQDVQVDVVRIHSLQLLVQSMQVSSCCRVSGMHELRQVDLYNFWVEKQEVQLVELSLQVLQVESQALHSYSLVV